jgi:pilus assembly protein CpaE
MPTRDIDTRELVLLIHEGQASIEPIREALADPEIGFRLQCVERLPTALARIAGGGVHAVVIDLSRSDQPENERLDSFLKFQKGAPNVPVIVLCGPGDENLALKAVRAGAADFLVRERCAPDLNRLLRSAIVTAAPRLDARQLEAAGLTRNGTVIALLGGKGGVATTTVALNVACALAQWSTAVLAEVRPMFGTLPQYFHPQHHVRNLAHLLRTQPHAIGRVEAEACLWPYKGIPGLSVLFGPLAIDQCREIAADQAKAVTKVLATLADHVVVDLPPTLSDSNRAVVESSDCLVVVVERDQIGVDSTKQVLRTIELWNAVPQFIGSVIVNRASLATPMPIPDIEAQLGIPTLAVIPPAPDLCVAAQKAGVPLVSFDPQSLMAQSLITLAGRLATEA